MKFDLERLVHEWHRFAGSPAALSFASPDRPDSAVRLSARPGDLFLRLAKVAHELGDSLEARRFFALPRAVGPELTPEMVTAPESTTSTEWQTSRTELLTVYDQMRALGADPARMKFSLSHSQGTCLSVSVAGPLGVGVDLEHSARFITLPVAERFLLPFERGLALSPLQIWVIKEACFKADPDNFGSILPGYAVTQCDGQVGEVTKLATPLRKIRFRVLREGDWIIAFALY